MDFNDHRRKIALEVNLNFIREFPMYLNKYYLEELNSIFISYGLKNFGFSGPLTKWIFKSKNGFYIKGSFKIILRTFFSYSLVKSLLEFSKDDRFVGKSIKISTFPVKISNEFYVVNQTFQEITPEVSENIREKLIERYKSLYGEEPFDKRLIVINPKGNKVVLYGSKELILMAEVFGLFGKGGYEDFLVERNYSRSVNDEDNSKV